MWVSLSTTVVLLLRRALYFSPLDARFHNGRHPPYSVFGHIPLGDQLCHRSDNQSSPVSGSWPLFMIPSCKTQLGIWKMNWLEPSWTTRIDQCIHACQSHQGSLPASALRQLLSFVSTSPAIISESIQFLLLPLTWQPVILNPFVLCKDWSIGTTLWATSCHNMCLI